MEMWVVVGPGIVVGREDFDGYGADSTDFH
jgi:hypothetical protein